MVHNIWQEKNLAVCSEFTKLYLPNILTNEIISIYISCSGAAAKVFSHQN